MQNNAKVRVVMVGCGSMSGTWLDVARTMPDVEIVGLVDIVEQAAYYKAREYNLNDAMVASDLRHVLSQTAPDAVFNCTIPEAHFTTTLEALRQGCHVLGEKPMADSMEHARMMITAAQQAGKLVAIIQNRRYDPRIRRLYAFLTSGVIGPLTTVNCDFYAGPHFGGFRDRMQHVLLLDMAIHTFDAARFLVEADPLTVYCKEWNPPGSWYEHDASAMAIFEMKRDIVYSYRGSWCADGLPTAWECDWRFVGQKGTVKWDGADSMQAQIVSKTGTFISSYEDIPIPKHDPRGKVGGHTGLIHEFIACIKSGTEPETICTDNIKSLAMVFGAIESAETGQRVTISPFAATTEEFQRSEPGNVHVE